MKIREALQTLYWGLESYFVYDCSRWYYRLRANWRAVHPRVLTALERQFAVEKGNVIDQMDRTIATSQMKCNHRKGGVIVRKPNETISSVKIAECLQNGTGSQFSVMKHQMMNGDWRVRCTRCGKTWTAPIREEYRKEREFWKAIEEYETAVGFPTDNVSSTSLQFRWRYRDGSDASEVPRKAMATRV